MENQMGRERVGDTKEMEVSTTYYPPGTDRDLGTGQGRKEGVQTDVGHGGGRRHAARGTETIGRGWRVEGGVEVKVENLPFQYWMWRAGDKKRMRQR